MPPYRDRRNGRWRYRKVIRLQDGRRTEVRGTPETNTKLAALRAEAAHVAQVLGDEAAGVVVVPIEAPERSIPTLNEFKKEFMATYVAANNKPSERMAKESMFQHHLLPEFGDRRLDEVTTRDIERFKAEKLKVLSPKSVNNLLTCLGKTLRYAAESEIIEKLPRVRFVKTFSRPIDFLDFEEWERLVEAARSDPETLPAILLGGDAGLRVGEIRALQWGDLDLGAGKITVQRTDYRGYEGTPKGGRLRVVPMTSRLLAALRAARHLKSAYVFSRVDGARWSRGHADTPLRRALRIAKLRKIGWHTLRHTFCSHLAMRGAPVRTIQELAGHAAITTTMQYMHLTPSAKIEAIRLLEQPTSSQHRLNED